MSDRGEKIYGPYEHPRGSGRQRLIIRGPRGSFTETFEGDAARDEAIAFKAKWLERTKGHTVRDAIETYIAERTKKGKRNGEPLKPETLTLYRSRLIEFIDGPVLVAELTPGRCIKLYESRTEKVRPDTHRAELATAAAFGDWCVRQGWLQGPHFHKAEPIGELSAGKPQLTIDEARAFSDAAIDLANDEDEGAIAALCALLMGMRSGEITKRIVRDLDDGGRVLRITKAKTKTGKRTLEVPDVLQPFLLGLAKGKRASERLFDDPARYVYPRHWLRDQVHRICRFAAVPIVCPHGLRGTQASLATEAGAVPHLVAAALGHAHTAVTNRHYTSESSRRNAAQRAAWGVLSRRSGNAEA